MKQAAIFFLIALLFGCGEDVPDRDQFLGQYSVMEQCDDLGEFTYDITIGISNMSEDKIEIENFGDFNLSLHATVNGSQLIFDEYLAGIDAQIEGSGSISEETVTINYVITNQYQDIVGNTFSDSCLKTCSRL